MFKQEFGQLSIFKGLSSRQLSLLDPMLELCCFPPEHIVFDQGQRTEYLYILLRGKVEVRFKPYDGPPLTVTRIEPGGVFGWSTALNRETYTSAAHTIEECETYRISGCQLQKFCIQEPTTGKILLERLASVIAERLNNTHTQILSILTQGIDLNGEDQKETCQDD